MTCLKVVDLFQAEQAGDPDRVQMQVPGANDPADDGNALVGVRYAVLIELALVALVVLLRWLL
jgi:hypothetical protein